MVNMVISLQTEKAVVQGSLKTDNSIPGLALIGVLNSGKRALRPFGDRSVELNMGFVFNEILPLGWAAQKAGD
jgi:hypothetical protein